MKLNLATPILTLIFLCICFRCDQEEKLTPDVQLSPDMTRVAAINVNLAIRNQLVASRESSFDPVLVMDEFIQRLSPQNSSIANQVLSSPEYTRFIQIFSSAKRKPNARTTSTIEFINSLAVSQAVKDALIPLALAMDQTSEQFSNGIAADGSNYDGTLLTSMLQAEISEFKTSVTNNFVLSQDDRSVVLIITQSLLDSVSGYVSNAEFMFENMYPDTARCRFLCSLAKFIGAVVLSVALVSLVGAAIMVPIAMIAGSTALIIGASAGGAYAFYEAVVENTCYSLQTSSGYGTTQECVQW